MSNSARLKPDFIADCLLYESYGVEAKLEQVYNLSAYDPYHPNFCLLAFT